MLRGTPSAMESVEQTREAVRADVGAGYPPAPWELYGQAQMHLLSVPAKRLGALPAGFRPLSIGRQGLVVAGWVSYERGSVLSYGELFAAPVGFVGGRPGATVTHMWVDSEASMRGGRELWGYPKELARFDLRIGPGGSAAAADGRGEIARGDFRPSGRRLALPLNTRAGTFQPLGGHLQPIRAIFRGTLLLGSGTFEPAEDGPLGHLHGARRLLSFGLRDFHFTFGIG